MGPIRGSIRGAARRLVLGSTSRYRKELLERLRLPFEATAPVCDESPLPAEAPAATALRLSILKAKSLETRFSDALIIGSDQVAAMGTTRLGKPGTHENAVQQLRALSGNTADFHTAVSLLDTASGALQSRVVLCRVHFRNLDDRQIERYLELEQPYDCAASAKAEALGIALIARMETDDPTSLIGLPLVALTEMLGAAGIPVL